MGGVAFPSTSSTVFTMGAGGSYRTHTYFGPGLFIQRYSAGVKASSDAGSAQIDTSALIIGADANVFFWGTLKGFVVGARLGIVRSTTKASASAGDSSLSIDTSTTHLFLGPRASYDYAIARFSVGGELYYMLGIGNSAPSAFLIQPTVKFWF